MSTATITAIDALDYQKYDKPIPSRDFILEMLKKLDDYLHRDEIAKQLNLSEDESKEALRRRLRAMERDGQVIYCRHQGYRSIDQKQLLCGHIIGHRDGFGFLKVDSADEDLFVPPSQMRRVFDGDEVQVRINGIDRRGRKEISIVKIIERNTHHVTGRLVYENDQYFLRPSNDRIANTIVLNKHKLMGASEGQIVVADITEYPNHRVYAQAQVREVLGDEMAPGMEINVVLKSLDIPHEWQQATTDAAMKFGKHVKSKDKSHRYDLRELPFVTIDGEDAKDFDDAVYCEPTKTGGWRLFVAIADVSHYVKPDSPLDLEAQERGTSIYFPGQVVPMLPEALSNGLCSLNPNVDRLAMVCEMTINRSGKMTDYQFSEGLIHSHARLTYKQVNALLTAPETRLGKQVIRRHNDIQPHLHDLYDLYNVLRVARDKRGAIDFETPEVQFVLNADRKIEKIKAVIRNDAHKLIEECMLCANVATAKFLEKHKLSALYRVHDGPQQKKLETMRAFLKEKGLSLGGGNNPTPKHYDQLLRRIEQRSDAKIIQTMMLRSLGQAEYSENNLGHFGLAYSAYAHFTSPIRRYPDLLVHRAIRSVIRKEQRSGSVRQLLKSVIGLGGDHVRRFEGAKVLKTNQSYPYKNENMQELATQCSLLSRRADKASWDVEARLKCEYMQDQVGEKFTGIIASVTSFGLFIELKDTLIEGLVHISSLKKDAYQFDAVKQSLVSRNGKKSYCLGDSIKIQVARVDLEQSKIEFLMIEPSKNKKRRKSKKV